VDDPDTSSTDADTMLAWFGPGNLRVTRVPFVGI
jgi:hypothetical protein